MAEKTSKERRTDLDECLDDMRASAEAKRMRNLVIHGHDQVNISIVWDMSDQTDRSMPHSYA